AGHTENAAGVALEGQDFLAGGRFPELDCAIGAAADDPIREQGIGTGCLLSLVSWGLLAALMQERHTQDPARMSLERQSFLTAVQVPELDGVVPAAAQQPDPIPAESQTGHRLRMPLQAAQQPAGGQVP